MAATETAIHVAESKYQIGDVVWWLHTFDVPATQPCPTCEGSGKVRIVNVDRLVDCPDAFERDYEKRCRVGRIPAPSVEKRCYIESRTIGQVRVVVTVDEPTEVTYMAHETGIGSGSVLREENLYPTRDAAVEASDGATEVAYR